VVVVDLAPAQPVDALEAPVLAQVAEHLVEGAVLHHQHDDVLDPLEAADRLVLVRMRAHPLAPALGLGARAASSRAVWPALMIVCAAPGATSFAASRIAETSWLARPASWLATAASFASSLLFSAV